MENEAFIFNHLNYGHQGVLKVESREIKRTEFIVSLPYN